MSRAGLKVARIVGGDQQRRHFVYQNSQFIIIERRQRPVRCLSYPASNKNRSPFSHAHWQFPTLQYICTQNRAIAILPQGIETTTHLDATIAHDVGNQEL